VSDGAVVFLVALAMAVGIAGTVLPVLPGLLLVWAAALVYGLAAGFGAIGWAAFALITAVALAGTAAGVVLPHRAAGASGASRWSVWFAFGVGVVGFFVVPVVGLPLGTVVGLLAAELVRTKEAGAAWRSTVATLKGFGLSTLVQLAAGLTMAVVWVAWVVLG
jgi:uncharacterized protein YqgC (DUF456 family)